MPQPRESGSKNSSRSHATATATRTVGDMLSDLESWADTTVKQQRDVPPAVLRALKEAINRFHEPQPTKSDREEHQYHLRCAIEQANKELKEFVGKPRPTQMDKNWFGFFWDIHHAFLGATTLEECRRILEHAKSVLDSIKALEELGLRYQVPLLRGLEKQLRGDNVPMPKLQHWFERTVGDLYKSAARARIKQEQTRIITRSLACNQGLTQKA